MRRFVLLAGVVGCVSSGAGSSPTPIPTDRAILTDDHTYKTSIALPDRIAINAPADKVWAALSVVYQGLGIDLTMVDRPNGRIGNASFIRRRKLGDKAMSNYIDCGSGFTGPKADDSRIYLSIISIMQTDPNGSVTLQTVLSSESQSIDGASSDRVACGTSGRLEAEIANRAKTLLGLK